MGLLGRLFNSNKDKRRQEQIALEEERKRLELERIRLEKERIIIEKEKKILEEKKRVEERLKKEEEKRLNDQRKAEEEYRYWQEWALNKQKLLIEEEQQVKEDIRFKGERWQVVEVVPRVDREMFLINIKAPQIDKQSVKLEIKENILEDEYRFDITSIDGYYEESGYEGDLINEFYSEFNQSTNSGISDYSISIEKVMKYNDSIYSKLGYDNVGYSGLYETFYCESKFNYENYEDILDYYDYVNDQ